VDPALEEKISRAGKNRAYAAYNEAELLAESGKLDEAGELFQEAAATTKNAELRKKALYNLGNTLLRLQDPVQALNTYQQAYDTTASSEKTQKALNTFISENMVLAKKLKQKQQEEQKDQQEGDGEEGEEEKKPAPDPGKPKQFQDQSFGESQKKKMFDLVAGEEQQALQRLQNKKQKTPSPKGKTW
jgi:tetratricopeptide (TPR) repeat protein